MYQLEDLVLNSVVALADLLADIVTVVIVTCFDIGFRRILLFLVVIIVIKPHRRGGESYLIVRISFRDYNVGRQ